MKSTVALLGAGAIVLAPASALAQAAPLTSDQSAAASRLNAKAMEMDTAIPESPGFAVIGLTPTQVIDPSATRVTLSTIAGYVDEKGNLKPGFAVGGTPYLWLNPNLTLRGYRDLTGISKVLARTQVTAGVADGGDGQPDKLGVGFTFDVLDGGDYRRDLKIYECVGNVYSALTASQLAQRRARRAEATATAIVQKGWDPNQLTHAQTMELSLLAESIVDKQENQEVAAFKSNGGVQTCRDQAKERYAKRTSLVVAGAWAFKSKEGGFDHLDSDGGSFWAAYRRPIGTAPYYGVLFARYDVDRKTEVTTGVFQDYDHLTLAALGGYDLPDRGFKLSLEAGYERLDYGPVGPFADKKSGFWGATLTQALPKNDLLGQTWLEVKAGSGASAVKPGDHDTRIRVSLRFARPQT
jgi:hypothetical protein